METKNLEYSVKNIPLSNKDVYQKTLIGKTEDFIRRLRWKVFHFLNKSDNSNDQKSNFGFRTPYSPQKNAVLENFENDLYDLIKNIEFKTVRNNFQHQVSRDLRSINNSKKIFVPADKTRNMYGLEPKTYEKLLKDNVTKGYKKTSRDIVANVNKEAFAITEELSLSERVQCIAENPAFITIKDHKPNFPNTVACRLLNPCKSEVGKISKVYLERINDSIRSGTNLNQWRNSKSVIDWFTTIPNKKNSRFIKFDIVSFYPSISRNILIDAIQFARNYCIINVGYRTFFS